MDDIVSSPAGPNPRKRSSPHDETTQDKLLNIKGDQFVMPTPPDTDQSSNNSPEDKRITSRAASPAPSSSALSTIETVSSADLPDTHTASTTAPEVTRQGQPSAKRRKLTPAEKLEKQQAQEVKEREKATRKAQREVEKRLKDEDKRKKAEEREMKRREKDLEEERRAQEKLKKERSQMRLGAFFQAKPSTSALAVCEGEEAQPGVARRRSLSFEASDIAIDQSGSSVSPTKRAQYHTPQRPTAVRIASTAKSTALSDYRKEFLPFELPSHSRLAPAQNQERTSEEIVAAQEAFDKLLNEAAHQQSVDIGAHQYFNYDRHAIRGIQAPSVRQIIDSLYGTSSQPIDLTDNNLAVEPMEYLKQVSIKHLHFSEDVRPAYCGTYTKASTLQKSAKLCRNPCSRIRIDTDYDYDSEAEWEEPEEGEDLLSDDEDEADDPADMEDIEGFLDDEDDTSKRKMITGDLVPTNTGLCWEDHSGHVSHNSHESGSQDEFRSMRIDFLLPGLQGKTIDPFSTEYWSVEPVATFQNTATKDASVATKAGLMAPPRPPLQQRSNTNASLENVLIGAAEGERGPITSIAGPQGAKRGRKPAPKTLSTEDLAEFKEAVVGSPLGKLDLLKGLKSRFPKITHETIKDTLGSQFAQVGNSKVDKKWVFVGST